MYNIVFTNRAIKDLENISSENQKRLAIKLKEYATNPLRYARKLSNSQIGTYRFRIGNYRVIFDIDGETIIVLRLGHRKEIYR